MKHQSPAHIPLTVNTALQETADRLGGVGFDTVVTAACWAFCTQGAEARRCIVADFWFWGSSQFGASRVDRRQPTFKEKVHALAAYCYAALRGCFAQ
jgi:hypothetical protein